MFSINANQFDALERTLKEALVDRLVDEVRQHHADAYGDLPDHALRMLVESGLERASAFGFQQQPSLATFVHLMFGVAPNFYRHPAVRAALADPALPLEERLTALPDRVAPNVWDEIVHNFDTTAW